MEERNGLKIELRWKSASVFVVNLHTPCHDLCSCVEQSRQSFFPAEPMLELVECVARLAPHAILVGHPISVLWELELVH